MAKNTPTRRQAVALRYDPKQDRAPKVVAKGRGSLAERILEVARAHNIPVREDKDLVQILSLLDLDREIPPELYRVVAEILAFVYGVSGERPMSSHPGWDEPRTFGARAARSGERDPGGSPWLTSERSPTGSGAASSTRAPTIPSRALRVPVRR